MLVWVFDQFSDSLFAARNFGLAAGVSNVIIDVLFDPERVEGWFVVQKLNGPLSAVPKPIFVTEGLLRSIFQGLHD